MGVTNYRGTLHIPVLIILQITFIILFGIFVRYDDSAKGHSVEKLNATGTFTEADLEQKINDKLEALNVYPMFQDVHVMIFIGFGFLMTFLKKYGLSAVSLNMLCAVIALEWATLTIGFFHLGDDGLIHLNVISILSADFASAAVLISFGAVIGKTSPLQLIVMALIEIVLFTANEIIGRKYLHAVDAGDTIFVHAYGAYFGLAISRVLYNPLASHSAKEGSAYTSDLFSMIGTIFLWLFWPSFNAAAAAPGDPQQRAILNTYYSLCACVLSSFAVSAFTHPERKFVMEHIQNATLAGGVAIGACADMMMQPYGAMIVGSVAGIVSTLGYHTVGPILNNSLKVHDTCGVHNLHGMPAVMGSLLSVIMAAIATREDYKDSLCVVFDPNDKLGCKNGDFSGQAQAINQLSAFLVTMVFAIVGGTITGWVMLMVGKFQHLEKSYRKGQTVVKLALNVGHVTAGSLAIRIGLPKKAYFDDDLFFEA